MNSENKIYSIYLITNTINGKQYVGKTTKTVHERWVRHRNDSKCLTSSMYNNPMQIDMREFGYEIFVQELLSTTVDSKEAKWLEELYTHVLRTEVPYGYNRCVGNKTFAGKKQSEYCINLLKSRRGVNSPSFGKRGELNYFYGKHHTEEQKKKISESRKGKCTGAQNPASRKVLCVELNRVFDTVRDAAKFVGIKSPCNISECCRGKQKTAGGYHWQYAD